MPLIRAAEPSDAHQISALVCALAGSMLVDPESEEARNFYAVMQPPNVARNMEKQDRFYLVAEIEGETVGMILILNNSYIGQFFVHAGYQRKGIGASLWKAALSRACHSGSDGSFTVKSSIAAEPVYRRFGFEPTGAVAIDSGFRYVPMSRGTLSAA